MQTIKTAYAAYVKAHAKGKAKGTTFTDHLAANPLPETESREVWLTRLMHLLALEIFEPFEPGSTKAIDSWRVSVGFPGGGARRSTIGQCWCDSVSASGFTEMFISPVLSTAEEADHVLVHEMVHASVGIKAGHKGPFTKMARGLGLEGKLTATTCGPELREKLDALTSLLGPYPHAGMDPGKSNLKKQSTRMLKLECPGCGYIARTTQKWIEVGIPTCCCGTGMELDQ